MSNFAPRRTTYDTGDRRWLRDMLKAETHGVTLDGDTFPAGTFPDGLVKSGTVVGIVTASGLAAPYNDAFDADAVTAGQQGDGRESAAGHLLNDVVIKAGEKHLLAVVHAGTVERRFLPANSGHDAAAEADLTAIAYIN